MSSFAPTPNIRVRRGPLDAVVGGINNGSLTHLNSVVNQNYLFQKPVIRESWPLAYGSLSAGGRPVVRSFRPAKSRRPIILATPYTSSGLLHSNTDTFNHHSNTSSMYNSTDDHRDVNDEVARLIVFHYFDPPTHQSMHSQAKWCGDLYGKLDVPHVEINCGEGENRRTRPLLPSEDRSTDTIETRRPNKQRSDKVNLNGKSTALIEDDTLMLCYDELFSCASLFRVRFRQSMCGSRASTLDCETETSISQSQSNTLICNVVGMWNWRTVSKQFSKVNKIPPKL